MPQAQPPVTSEQIRHMACRMLSDAEIPEFSAEADRIVCHVLGVERSSLHAHPDRIVSGGDFSRVVEFTIRRATHEPLAYILGSSFFCGINLKVNSRTLIPRPETEILCDAADGRIKEMRLPQGGVFADWCTGSGALAISLALRNPGWRCVAVDSSLGALAVARENAASHGLANRIEFIECSNPDRASSLIPHESLDLIVSNPPYIPSSELASLERQVASFEPAEALDGGPDGLDIYRLLLRTLPRYMKPGAPLLFETAGNKQAEAIASMPADAPSQLVCESVFEDHRGIERFMLWRK